MKKRTVILILAVLGACACSRNTVLTPDLPEAPIGFSWYARRAVDTKANPAYFVGGTGASGAERRLNDGTSMGVFGYFHPQENGNPGTWKHGAGVYNTPNLFYNEPVSITQDGDEYSYDYDNSRYWPKNGLDRISFIAYYPWNELNTTGTASAGTIVEPFLDSRQEREGMVGFYYVVPQNSDDQVDFMVSDLCLEQSKVLWDQDPAQGLTGAGKVKFFFHHALSQVRVKEVRLMAGGNPDIELEINYILFKNVAVFGQCVPAPDFANTDASGRTPVTPAWPVGTLVPRRPDLSSGVTAGVCYDATLGTWDVNEFLLMIPHTFFEGATIEVNFNVRRKTDAETGEYYTYENNTLAAPLATNISGWEAGKIYTYVISLDLKQIKVDATVDDWFVAGEDVLMDQS